MAAAMLLNFAILLMPDMSALGGASVDQLVDLVGSLAMGNSAYRTKDGRLIVAPYLAERKSVQWWRKFVDRFQERWGVGAALWPVLLDNSRLLDFAKISFGVSDWGEREPWRSDPINSSGAATRRLVLAAQAYGVKWMQPVSMQDERPRAGIYQESQNTLNLRLTWELAIENNADWVQLVTWNDYAEGTQLAPSLMHGDAFLRLVAYYSDWFHNDREPEVNQDHVVLTHRVQFVNQIPSYHEVRLMRPRAGTLGVDRIEVVAIVSHPASIVIKSGSSRLAICNAPAGVSACDAPLVVGTISAEVVRGAEAVVTVASPFEVKSRVYVQDLQYVAVTDGWSQKVGSVRLRSMRGE